MGEAIVSYKELNHALAQFKDAHKDVFATYEGLLQAIAVVEEEIKSVARETKEDFEQGGVSVKVIRRFSKWYDASVFLPREMRLLEGCGAVKREVVKELFEQLVAEGKISEKRKADAFRETELTSSVSIKYKPV